MRVLNMGNQQKVLGGVFFPKKSILSRDFGENQIFGAPCIR
jgi:hypothetical protein